MSYARFFSSAPGRSAAGAARQRTRSRRRCERPERTTGLAADDTARPLFVGAGMKKRSRSVVAAVLSLVGFGVVLSGQNVPGTATTPGNIWPPAMLAPAGSPALSPADALKTFSTPPGFHVELVASEPMIESPILMDFDADGRLYVLEQLTFLPDTSGRDSREPLNRVSVLEDTDGDGKMDKKTVFADKLSMPRALKV